MESKSALTLFEKVASYYRRMISLGVYKDGDFLPSVRETALSMKINPNTVVRGYALLEEEGLVCSIPKKGYLVKKGRTPMEKEAIKQSLASLIKQGYEIDEIEEALNELKKGERR